MKLVNEIFGIPNDTILIDMKLVSKVDTKQERLVPENSKDYSFDSIEDMNNLTSEVYKRRLSPYYRRDILRKNIADGTPLGVEAKGYMDKGALVPDELVINLLKNLFLFVLLCYHPPLQMHGLLAV